MKTSGRNDKQRTCTYHDAHVARTTNNETFFFEFSHLRDLSLFGLIKRKTEINNNNNNNGGKASEEMAHSAQCPTGPGKFQIGWPTLTRRGHRRTPFIHPSVAAARTFVSSFRSFVQIWARFVVTLRSCLSRDHIINVYLNCAPNFWHYNLENLPSRWNS